MADFNKPTVTSTYTNVLSELAAKDLSIAKMFDGTSDTNLPTDVIKYDGASSKKLQKWNGSAWVDQTISGLATDAVTTASILADAVTTAKFRGANNAYLRWRNAAGSADLNVLQLDSSDNTFLNGSASKKIILANSGTSQWEMTSTGDLIPATDVLKSIGSTSFRSAYVWTKRLHGVDSILTQPNNDELVIGTQGTGGITLKIGNIAEWVLSDTTLRPASAGGSNLGNSSFHIAEGHFNLLTGISLVVRGNTAGNLYLGAGATSYHQILSGVGAIEPTTDNATDIGVSARVYRFGYFNEIKNRAGDISIRPTAGGVTLHSTVGAVLHTRTDGILELTNQSFGASDGSVINYLLVYVNGALRKIPLCT